MKMAVQGAFQGLDQDTSILFQYAIFPEPGTYIKDYATSCIGFLPNQCVATFSSAQSDQVNQTSRRLIMIEDSSFEDPDQKTIQEASRFED